MEGIAPPLRCLLEVKLAVENGEAFRPVLHRWAQNTGDTFSRELKQWLFYIERNENGHPPTASTPYRKALFDCFAKGLNGEPIFGALNEIEEEMTKACRDDLERHLQKLPVITLIPLLLFQFPAFLLLLLGPLLTDFLTKVSQV